MTRSMLSFLMLTGSLTVYSTIETHAQQGDFQSWQRHLGTPPAAKSGTTGAGANQTITIGGGRTETATPRQAGAGKLKAGQSQQTGGTMAQDSWETNE